MAISTYAELKSAAATWLVRGDLTARIPEFIALAESRLNRLLRTRRAEQDVALTGTPGSRAISLPATYSEALNCWLTLSGSATRQPLRFIDPALLVVDSQSGQPRAWTIDGANLAFDRPCDQAYAITLRCLLKYALSDDAPTNDLLTNYPDAYLFGVLNEASPFLRDADLAQAYAARYDTAISEINAKEGRSRAQQTLSTDLALMQDRNRRSGFDIRTGQ